MQGKSKLFLPHLNPVWLCLQVKIFWTSPIWIFEYWANWEKKSIFTGQILPPWI